MTTETQALDYRGGCYRTGDVTPGIVSRSWPTGIFCIRCWWIIYKASRLAQKEKYRGQDFANSSFDVLRALESVGVRIVLTGLDKIGAVDGPCVFIANHMSTLETLVLPGIVQPVKDVTFIVKRGIIEYPIFKHIMLVRDPIVVDRVNPREDLQVVMENGTKILQSGRSLIVFPQTTRTFQFEPERFNTIGVKLARRANVPIVPVAVKSDAWTNGRVVKEFGKIDVSKVVHLEFGDAIHIQGRGAEEHRAIIDFITERLEAWRALDDKSDL